MHTQPTGAVYEQASGMNLLNGSRCSNHAMMHMYALNEATWYQNFCEFFEFWNRLLLVAGEGYFMHGI